MKIFTETTNEDIPRDNKIYEDIPRNKKGRYSQHQQMKIFPASTNDDIHRNNK
jgi:hypothetical protein